MGCLGESASEARNKFYKDDRLSHARQNSRINNLSDVYHRAMDSSDPLLSSLCLTERRVQNKKTPFPRDVIDLLQAPSFCSIDNRLCMDDEESTSDNECMDDDESTSDNECYENSYELDVEEF